MRRKVIDKEGIDRVHGGATWWAMKLECGHEAMFRHNGSVRRKFPLTMTCIKCVRDRANDIQAIGPSS